MIVQHGERETARLIEYEEIALEVHLPQLVGLAALEALPGGGIGRGLLADAPVAMQDRIDRAGCELGQPHIDEASAELARAPSRVGIAQLQHLLLELRRTDARAGERATGEIGKRLIAAQFITSEYLVSRLPADAETPAQLTERDLALERKAHEIKAKLHDVLGVPRHGWSRAWHARKCQPCPRTPVSDVSGPYTAAKKVTKETALPSLSTSHRPRHRRLA